MADDDMSTKRCSKCSARFPLNAFARNRIRADGRELWCRPCKNACSRAAAASATPEKKAQLLAVKRTWRKANRDKVNGYTRAWQLRNPEKVRANSDDWAAANRHRIRARQKAAYQADPVKASNRRAAYRARDPQKHLKVIRAWSRANKQKVATYTRARRALKKTAEGCHGLDDVLSILAAQGGRCAYCRAKLGSKYHVDHIVPLSKGGSNDRRNIQVTCAHCNLSKLDKHPLDYARRIGLLL